VCTNPDSLVNDKAANEIQKDPSEDTGDSVGEAACQHGISGEWMSRVVGAAFEKKVVPRDFR
jgi:hypothetical protein